MVFREMLLPACRNPYLLKNCNLGHPTTYTSLDGARRALSQALPELFALPLRQLVPLFMLISPLATAPILTIHDYIPQKESIILQYSLTSAGTIWCRAYREEEKEYATVEGVYAGIQGIAVVAHVISNYYIGNLEPNTDYYTFCVAEDEHQVAMSTLFESTERHVITLAGTPSTRGFLIARAAIFIVSWQHGDVPLHFNLGVVQRPRRRLQLHRDSHPRLRLPLGVPGETVGPGPRAAPGAVRPDVRLAAERDGVRGVAVRGGPEAAALGAAHRVHDLLHHHRLHSLLRRGRLDHHGGGVLRGAALRARVQRRDSALVRLGGRLGRAQRRVR